jgi:hypothetical protein
VDQHGVYRVGDHSFDTCEFPIFPRRTLAALRTALMLAVAESLSIPTPKT